MGQLIDLSVSDDTTRPVCGGKVEEDQQPCPYSGQTTRFYCN